MTQLRDYEISIWTLQDEFISALKPSNIEWKGLTQKNKTIFKVDGTQTCTFSIPKFINTDMDKRILNPYWGSVENGKISKSLHKIKVIFNKHTNFEKVFEFVIIDVKDKHEEDQVYCEVSCEGLAFHELGKHGYKISLSSEQFNNEAYDWFIGNQAAAEPQPTLQYWNESNTNGLGLTKFPTSGFIDRTVWYYDIQMDWSSYTSGRDSDKVYEEEYVSSWVTNNDKLIPSTIEGAKEKIRLVDIEESNVYNITQKIAEIFGVFCKYEYQYDDNYHIIGRKIIYYNNFINEKEGYFDLTYPYSTSSVTRELASQDVTTKMFVNITDDDDITITDVEANKSKEDYLLNFDYLYQTGDISQEQYDSIDSYQLAMRQYNETLIDYSNKLNVLQNRKADVKARAVQSLNSIQLDKERIENSDNLLNSLDVKDADADGAITVSSSHPDQGVLLLDELTQRYYVNITQIGVLSNTLHLYRTLNYAASSVNNILSNEITTGTIEYDEYGNVTKVSNLTLGSGDSRIVYLTYKYRPQLQYEQIKQTWQARLSKDNASYNEAITELDNIELQIDNIENAYDVVLAEKKEAIKNFEQLMGPALRESYWRPDDYKDCGNKYNDVLSVGSRTGNSGFTSFIWDTNSYDDEQQASYEVGVNQEIFYYPCIDLSSHLSAIQNYTDKLSFLFYDYNKADLENAELNRLRALSINSLAQYGFVQVGAVIKPVLILTGAQSMTQESLNRIVTKNPVVGDLVTTISDQGVVTTELTTYFNVSASDFINLSYNSSTGNYSFSAVTICYPRIKIDSLKLKENDTDLVLRYNDINCENYQDYYLLMDTDNATGKSFYYLTIKPHVILAQGSLNFNYNLRFALSNADVAIYLDALSILRENSIPKVSYKITPSLFNSSFVYTAYDKLNYIVNINDTDLQLRDVQGYISQVELDLDDPQNDKYEIADYRTKFEDLFSTIVAQTEAMQKSATTIDLAATALSTNGLINQETLQNTLRRIDFDYAFNNGTLTINEEDGIWGTSDSGVVAFRGGGIFTATEQDEDGNWKWNTGIVPEGINADLITTGQLDTNLIRIYGGDKIRFQLNGDGLFAYKSIFEDEDILTAARNYSAVRTILENNVNNDIDKNQYVVHNENGLFLIAKQGAYVLNEDKNNFINLADNVERVAISWDGLTLRNWNNEKVFYADADTGNLTLRGRVEATAFVLANSDPTQPDINFDDYLNDTIDDRAVSKQDGVVNSVVEYGTSSTSDIPPSSWSSTAPDWAANQYIWMRTKIVKGNGDISYTPSSDGVCIQAAAARSIVLTGESAFLRDVNTGTTTPNLITLTATTTNLTIGKWYYKNNVDTWIELSGNSGLNSYTFTTSTANIWNNNKVVIKVEDTTANYSDIKSVTLITNGANGASGSNAKYVSLTNENISFSADASGKVNAHTFNIGLEAYDGITPVTPVVSSISGSITGQLTVTAGTAVNNVVPITVTTISGQTLNSQNSGVISITITSPLSTTLTINWNKVSSGSNGRGISFTEIKYAKSSSGTTVPTNWGSSVPTITPTDTDRYLWTRTTITYTDNSAATVSYSVAYHGTDGSDGTSITILGSYDTLAELQAAHPTGEVGDGYIVGTHLYIWSADNSSWVDVGQIKGEDGQDGLPTYVHFAYATNSTGTENFNTNAFEGATYLGVYSDNTQADSQTPSDYTWSLIKGEDGSSPTLYELVVSNSTILKNLGSPTSYTPAYITLSATSQIGNGELQPFTSGAYTVQYYSNDTWKVLNATNGQYIIPTNEPISLIKCLLYLDSTKTVLLDQETLPVVSQGEDAYTVILDNENHTFAASSTAALESATTCGIIAYKGITRVAATIGQITGHPTGMTTSISSNGTTTASFTVTVNSLMTSKNGVLNVPITVDGKLFNMKFTYALAMAGPDGVSVTRYFALCTPDNILRKNIYATYSYVTNNESDPRGARVNIAQIVDELVDKYVKVYNIRKIILNGYSQTGDEGIVPYAGRFRVEKTIDNENWTTIYQSAANEESCEVILNFDAETLAYRYFFYLAGGFTTVIDQGLITVIDVGRELVRVVPLYYLKNNTTKPAKPTAKVTSEVTTANVWTTAIPEYLSGYYYFRCEQSEYNDNTIEWSDPHIDYGITAANQTATIASTEAAAVVNYLNSAFNVSYNNGVFSDYTAPWGTTYKVAITSAEGMLLGSNSTFTIANGNASTSGAALVMDSGGIALHGSTINLTTSNNTSTNVIALSPTNGITLASTAGLTLEGGNISMNSGNLALTSGNVTLNSGNLTLNSGDILLNSTGQLQISSGNLQIDSNGNVTITGNITATTGSIGGWTIGTNQLNSGSSTSYVALNSDTTGTYAIWAGAEIAASAPFSVERDGSIKAIDGIIGGWTLDSTSLHSGTGTNYVGLSSNTSSASNYVIWAGNSTAANAPFRVMSDGSVYLTKLYTVNEQGAAATVNLNSYPLWKLNTDFIRSASVENNTLTLTYFSGNTVNFSKANVYDYTTIGYQSTLTGATLNIGIYDNSEPAVLLSSGTIYITKYNNDHTIVITSNIDGTMQGGGTLYLSNWYESGWNNAVADISIPSGSNSESFSFTVPNSTVDGDPVTYNYTMTKGTPGTSGYAAVSNGVSAIARIDISDWYTTGWSNAYNQVIPPSANTSSASNNIYLPNATPGGAAVNNALSIRLNDSTPSEATVTMHWRGSTTIGLLDVSSLYTSGQNDIITNISPSWSGSTYTVSSGSITLATTTISGSWNTGTRTYSVMNGTNTLLSTIVSATVGGQAIVNEATYKNFNSSHRLGIVVSGSGATGNLYTCQIDATDEYNAGISEATTALTISSFTQGNWDNGSITVTAKNTDNTTLGFTTVTIPSVVAADWSSNYNTSINSPYGAYNVTVQVAEKSINGQINADAAYLAGAASVSTTVFNNLHATISSSGTTSVILGAQARNAENTILGTGTFSLTVDSTNKVVNISGSNGFDNSVTGTVNCSSIYTAGENNVINNVAGEWNGVNYSVTSGQTSLISTSVSRSYSGATVSFNNGDGNAIFSDTINVFHVPSNLDEFDSSHHHTVQLAWNSQQPFTSFVIDATNEYQSGVTYGAATTTAQLTIDSWSKTNWVAGEQTITARNASMTSLGSTTATIPTSIDAQSLSESYNTTGGFDMISFAVGGRNFNVSITSSDAYSKGYTAGVTAGENGVTIVKGNWSGGQISFTKSTGTQNTKTVQLSAGSISWGTGTNVNIATVPILDGSGSTGYSVTVDAIDRYNAGYNAVTGSWDGTWSNGQAIVVIPATTGNVSRNVTVTAPTASKGVVSYDSGDNEYTIRLNVGGDTSQSIVQSGSLAYNAGYNTVIGSWDGTWSSGATTVILPATTGGTSRDVTVTMPGSASISTTLRSGTVSTYDISCTAGGQEYTDSFVATDAYNNGVSSVTATLTAAGWSGGSNVITAKRGSTSVTLGTLTLAAPTISYNSNNYVAAGKQYSITVNVGGANQTFTMSATEAYNAGWGDAVGSRSGNVVTYASSTVGTKTTETASAVTSASYYVPASAAQAVGLPAGGYYTRTADMYVKWT